MTDGSSRRRMSSDASVSCHAWTTSEHRGQRATAAMRLVISRQPQYRDGRTAPLVRDSTQFGTSPRWDLTL